MSTYIEKLRYGWIHCQVKTYPDNCTRLSSILVEFQHCLLASASPRKLRSEHFIARWPFASFSRLVSARFSTLIVAFLLSEMTTSEIELWYRALFEEDCLRVKELLSENNHLLKVGWKRDDLMIVEGCPGNHWKSPEEVHWMGRTALHVGARRGDLELVQQVLLLCDIPDVTSLATETATANYKEVSAEEATAKQSPEDGEGIKGDSGRLPQPDFTCNNCTMYPIIGARFQLRADPSLNVCSKCFFAEKGGPADEYEEINSRIGFHLVGRTPKKPNQPSTSRGTIDKGKTVGSSSEDDKLVAIGEKGLALERYKASVANLSYTPSGRISWEPLVDFDQSFISMIELRELLVSKDGWYDLDVLAMATLHGNVDIIGLLVYAFGECDDSPYDINKSTRFSSESLTGNEILQRMELRNVTKNVIDRIRQSEPTFVAAFEEEYSRHRDFNFLPFEEFSFHFSWTSRFEDVFHEVHKNLFRNSFWQKVWGWPDIESERVKGLQGENPTERDELQKEKNSPKLWHFLLKLHDGQGRPPMHVATDEGIDVDNFWLRLGGNKNEEVVVCLATTPDGSGKYYAHRAVAMGKISKAGGVSVAHHKKCIYPVLDALKARNLSSYSLSSLSGNNGFRYGFSGSTPLQFAVIHKSSAGIGMRLLDQGTRNRTSKEAWKVLYRFDIDARVDSTDFDNGAPDQEAWKSDAQLPEFITLDVDIMELACFVGADSGWVRLLLERGYLHSTADRSLKCVRNDRTFTHWWPIFHLAATYGDYRILKLFNDYPSNHFDEDTELNTPLHCVMKDGVSVKKGSRVIQFHTHLLDYVSCGHLCAQDQRKKKKDATKTFFADRQGCIDLLLQAGHDMFKANQHKEVPYPEGRLSSSPEFLTWWYDKQAKEFAAVQSGLNTAANAITVTATLVAATSFLGPLQPPRSYSEDDQMEYENIWVATFAFCDTFSFYLAIVAIIISLLPALPMPQQAMFDELRRTRNMVTLAVAILFPSVISVLVAFAAGSIAVVTPKVTSALGRNLAVSSLSLGGLLAVGAFFFFTVRLLGIWFPRNSRIRYLYNLTTI